MAISVKREMLWPALWGTAAVLLAAIIAAEHFLGRVTVGEEPRAPAKIAEAKLLPPFSLPAEPQPAPETVSRPLFVPTRRPSPPAAPATVTTMKKGQFVLTGVTVTPELSFAFLKEVAGGKTHSVKKGSQVNGITVEAVEPRRVVLKQGEETEDLALNIQVPARVAGAPGLTGAVPPAPGMPGAVPPAPGTPPPLPTAGAAPPPGMGTAQPTAAPAATVPGQPAATPPIPAPATGRRRPWINAQ
jgi:hypothetical protein